MGDRLKWKVIPYAFHIDPATGKDTKGTRAARVEAMADTIVSDLRAVVERAKNGDANAKAILDAAGWYSEMRDRLRAEFGGLGDLFADILGATSPQTPVRTNWDFAIDALSNALSGNLDAEIDAYAESMTRIEAAEASLADWLKGQPAAGEAKKTAEYKAKLAAIKGMKAAAVERARSNIRRLGRNAKGGEVQYVSNNHNMIRALVGLWRVVTPGSAPKAINFSGNLIGYSRKATIDVWAARYLRDLASRALDAAAFRRIPTSAEKGVGGNIRVNLEPGAEFGFGQEVMALASEKLRNSGMRQFKETQADDLQAIVWFLEKERWGKNAWTSRTGEGGSFELEANLAGDPDRDGIAKLRKDANAG
jgi:hypothetical protein